MINRTIYLLIILFTGAYQLSAQTQKVLIVTGGKTPDKESFYNLFSELSYDTISKPAAFTLFGSDKLKVYKAILFYDTYQPINGEEKNNFLKIFENGIGVFFLHHSIVSHQEWDEYEKIVGGKYFHQKYSDEGKVYGPSTYKHDQDFIVKISDNTHPVTKGLSDFEIHDETYLNYRVKKNVKVLLTTDYRESGEILGWTHTYNKSNVVFIMLGHDKAAFHNKNFRKLIKNSINYLLSN
jgi:type 1 glutamine amidotransferase